MEEVAIVLVEAADTDSEAQSQHHRRPADHDVTTAHHPRYHELAA
jgi:hypothetical protein